MQKLSGTFKLILNDDESVLLLNLGDGQSTTGGEIRTWLQKRYCEKCTLIVGSFSNSEIGMVVSLPE